MSPSEMPSTMAQSASALGSRMTKSRESRLVSATPPTRPYLTGLIEKEMRSEYSLPIKTQPSRRVPRVAFPSLYKTHLSLFHSFKRVSRAPVGGRSFHQNSNMLHASRICKFRFKLNCLAFSRPQKDNISEFLGHSSSFMAFIPL
jgi:hypothetical protein